MKKFSELEVGQVFKDKAGCVLIKVSESSYNVIRDKFWNIITPRGTPRYEPIARHEVGYITPIDFSKIRIRTAEVRRDGYVPKPAFLYDSLDKVVEFFND